MQVPGSMLGQHKRPLEQAVLAQPVKYRKHSAEGSCEPNAWPTSAVDAVKIVPKQRLFTSVPEDAIATNSFSQALTFDTRGPVDQDEIQPITPPSQLEKAPDSDMPEGGRKEGCVEARLCGLQVQLGSEKVSEVGGVMSSLKASAEFCAPQRALDGPLPGFRFLARVVGENKSCNSRNIEMGLPENIVEGEKDDMEEWCEVEEPRGQSEASVEEFGEPMSKPLTVDVKIARIVATSTTVEGAGLCSLSAKSRDLTSQNSTEHIREERERHLRSSMDVSHVENMAFQETVQRTLEARQVKGSRPVPVLMGEKVVNLLALSTRVNELGGYSKVTAAGTWGIISKDLGLGIDCGPGVKLVYVKYLKAMDSGRPIGLQIKSNVPSVDSLARTDAGHQHCSELEFLNGRRSNENNTVSEQFAESDPCSRDVEDMKENGECFRLQRAEQHQSLPEEDFIQRVSRKRDREVGMADASLNVQDCSKVAEQLGASASLSNCKQAVFEAELSNDNLSDNPLIKRGREEGSYDSPRDQSGANRVDDWDEEGIARGRSQQQEASVRMLEWMKRVALNPCHSKKWQGARGTGQNEDWVLQCRDWAAKMRSLLWIKRVELRSLDGHLHHTKQMISPSSYYEDTTRLRATRERMAHYGFQLPVGPSNRSTPPSEQDKGDVGFYASPSVAQPTQRMPRQASFPGVYNEIAHPRHSFIDRLPHKRVPIGPDFQARVLPWISSDNSCIPGENGRAGDETQSSDEEGDDSSRWLGSQIWPLPGGKRMVNKHRVGRGRPATCSCHDPGSVNCVRLHVEMEARKLRSELGEAFHLWGFDQMGECVSSQWTKEAEQMFKAVVKVNGVSRDKNFWDYLPQAFPTRSTKELVSYYFNVFVLQRRAIQNRLDDEAVDSDDDETELPELPEQTVDSEDDSDDDEPELHDGGSEDGDSASAEEDDDGSEGCEGDDRSPELSAPKVLGDLGGLEAVMNSEHPCKLLEAACQVNEHNGVDTISWPLELEDNMVGTHTLLPGVEASHAWTDVEGTHEECSHERGKLLSTNGILDLFGGEFKDMS